MTQVAFTSLPNPFQTPGGHGRSPWQPVYLLLLLWAAALPATRVTAFCSVCMTRPRRAFSAIPTTDTTTTTVTSLSFSLSSTSSLARFAANQTQQPSSSSWYLQQQQQQQQQPHHQSSQETTVYLEEEAKEVETAEVENENDNGDVDDSDLDSFLVQDLRKQYEDLWATTERRPIHTGSTVTESTTATTPSSRFEREIVMARLLLLGAAALYGTNFSLVKLLGETDMSIGVSSTVRFGMAALATLPWLLMPPKQQQEQQDAFTSLSEGARSGASSSSSSNQVVASFTNDPATAAALSASLAGFEVGLWNSIGYVAQAVGLETTAASKSAFLCSLAVVTVPLLDKFVLGKSLLGRQMTGIVLALAGVALLELGGENLADLHLTSGDVASLLQPIAFGLGFWRMEHAMHKYPDQANRSTAAQLLAVFLASAVYAQIVDPNGWHPAELWNDLHNPTILLGLVWTGVISTALTVYMETVALKTLSAAETTLIFSTEPLWGTAFAALIMHEQLGIDAGIGALLILTGCVFSNLGIKGIQELVGWKPGQAEVTVDVEPDTKSMSTQKRSSLPFSDELSLMRALAVSSLGASINNAWNTVSIGTKVMAIELEDLLQDIFPFLADKQ